MRHHRHRLDNSFNAGFGGASGCLLAVAVFFLGIPVLCCAGFLVLASSSKSRVEGIRQKVEEKKRADEKKEWPAFQIDAK